MEDEKIDKTYQYSANKFLFVILYSKIVETNLNKND